MSPEHPMPLLPRDHDDIILDQDRQAERMASLKAGALASISGGSIFVGAVVFNHQVIATTFPAFWVLQMQGLNWQGLGSGVIALLSVFLFGVTYRYIVRTDENPQLQSGAVMAFSMARGLAQVDVGVMANGTVWPFAVLGLRAF